MKSQGLRETDGVSISPERDKAFHGATSESAIQCLVGLAVGLSGLVVGRASYEGVGQAAGPASTTVRNVNMKKGSQARKRCSGATGVAWADLGHKIPTTDANGRGQTQMVPLFFFRNHGVFEPDQSRRRRSPRTRKPDMMWR